MPTSTPLGLERLRKRKGISLRQISDSTKIGTNFLEAIESQQFEKLPGGVFDRNYLRQYAAATGFEEHRLLSEYDRFQAERTRQEEASQPRPPKRMWVLRWLTSALAVFVSVFHPNS